MILGGTNSYIRVELFGKIVKIQGELLMNGFIAYKKSITKWESPNDNETIDDKTKELIIQHVFEESQKADFKIEFE